MTLTAQPKQTIPYLKMDSLAFWQGVKKCYGAFQALPFELELSSEGLITQKVDAGRLDTIRKAYEGLEYEHPTKIAGQSAWGNKLHGINLDFLLSGRTDFRNCTVVEIGGGNLALSRPLLEKGIAKFVAVDPTIREVNSGEKLQVVKEFFSPSVAARISSADVIISFGCLEHVFDPLEFLTEIRRILVDDGIAVLTLPNVTTQLRTGDLSALWHEHISYFTESSLRKTVAQADLEFALLDATGDRFAIMLRKKTGPSEFSGKAVEAEFPAKQFSKTVQQFKAAIQDDLERGLTVGFHGANVGLNNFLSLTGLGQDTRLRIFDGDESKTAAFLPVSQSPIVHSSDKAYGTCQRIYVAATSFYAEIVGEMSERHGLSPEVFHLMRSQG